MAATLTKSNNNLLSRLKALANLQSQFQVQRLKHTLPGLENMQPEVDLRGKPDMSKWKSVNAKKLGVHRMMIPKHPWVVLNRLRNDGFQVYLVGGCVRDLILKRVPKDFDLITTATLIQVKRRFYPCVIVGQRFPVCRVLVKKTVIEVSSFETIAQHEKEREKVLMPTGCNEPDFIRWKNSMHRDFTINSLFYDPFVNKIYDYANGIADLRNLKLQTLIPAQVSFMEDCARILRAIRIAARLGLSFSKDIETAIQNLSSSIKTLDKTRLTMELNTMLSYGAAELSLCLLQKVGLLEFLFPFHAEYLVEQGTRQCFQRSTMLMKLFSNLDKLVACDRPSNSSVWVGLLAFHLALVNNPQDALVVRAFASVLYHGKWKEGTEFAREHAQVQVNFVPEISSSSDYESDEKLAEGVSKLASLVQQSISGLTGAKDHISKKARNSVADIFHVLVDDIKSYDEGRESFDINYHSLGEGSLCETRLVLGQVILGTMNAVEKEEDRPPRLEIENEQKSTNQEAVTSKSGKRKR